jgi:predicted GNAT family N-acyltransferase
MITNFIIRCEKNSLITRDILDKIIALKNQYWKYPKKSHEKWILENLYDDEYHLWIENSDGEIIAYLNIVFLNIRFDNRIENVIGIGNVCVDRTISGKGVGFLIMLISNYYILNIGKRAMLLCKRTLSKFYHKAGWIEFTGKVIIKGKDYKELLMFSKVPEANCIEIERLF